MQRTLLAIVMGATSLAGCKTTAPLSDMKDSSIVVTPPDNQRGTAFCWAYAVVAHLEQRYYEATRGDSGGGFRLNFSEEYLGLIRIAQQLINGEELQEGLKLSDSLNLVEHFGIVPEAIGNKNFFRAKFDFGVADDVSREAQAWWQDKGLAEFSAMPPKDAFSILKAAAKLTEAQTKFLAAAMGHGPEQDARFSYAGGTFTPQTWAKTRLKFSAKDYYVLKFPDSGRGQFNDKSYADEYLRSLALVKKALLYGYSVPVSFNMLRGALQENGVLGCVENGCWDADLSVPSPTNPHANHAVLLIDYRTARGRFGPTSAADIEASFATAPSEWVIKNSWGFNGNTSSHPDLLKRYPLPAFTVMLQDYYEASHKMDPGRYEALLPREVCLRDQTRAWQCESLVDSNEPEGIPSAADANLSLNLPLITRNQNSAGLSRYPVTFAAGVRDIAANDRSPAFSLINASDQSHLNIDQVHLKRGTRVTGVSADFLLCARVNATPAVKYVAMYMTADINTPPPPAPTFVLADQNQWQHCVRMQPEDKTFHVYLQGLSDRFQATSQIKTTVTIKP